MSTVVVVVDVVVLFVAVIIIFIIIIFGTFEFRQYDARPNAFVYSVFNIWFYS